MEFIFITFISSVFLSLEFLPYFYSLFITPAGFVSLSVTHYAYDYFYYLSHMAQGASHVIFSTNLHTGEPQIYTYIGWVYVLFGKLFSLFGIFQTVGYQIASFIMMLLFLFVLYQFLRSIFPQSWKKRVGAFGLFLFSNALVTIQNGHLTFFDTWNNFGSPFIRLEMVPHHLLTQTLLVASLFLIFTNNRNKTYASSTSEKFSPKGSNNIFSWGIPLIFQHYHHILVIFLSFLLSTLQPLQWMLMGTSVGIISFLLKPSFTSLLPGILWILAGLPSVFFLRTLFQTQPYINTLTWEAAQQQIYTILNFFQYNGIVAILGVIGLPCILRKDTKPLTLLLFYSLLSLALFFSPVPQYFSLLNIRFLSSLPTLLFAISTVELLSHFYCYVRIYSSSASEKFSSATAESNNINSAFKTKPLNGPPAGEAGLAPQERPGLAKLFSNTPIDSSMLDIVYWILGIVVIALLLPPLFSQMKTRLVYDTNNAYFFLSKGAYDALINAPLYSTMNDVFLVQWPFSAPFTGLSGRREYHSNFLATINSIQKEAKSREFFDKKMSEEEMKAFLKENHITRIITYPWTFSPLPSFLKEMYKTDMLAIYTNLN